MLPFFDARMTDSEQCFDRLTRLAAKALGVPAARLCLDEEHRRLIAVVGRDRICEEALAGGDASPGVLTVPVTLRGATVGVLAVAAEKPRAWTQPEIGLLEQFARTAAAELELEIALREADARRPHARDPHRRILVAEDDEATRRLILHAIEADHYSIVQAANGREALDVMHEQEVDLVVLDLVMPDLSGWDVLQHRATDARLREIPVIVVSARRGPDMARAVAFGIYGLLPKPFEPEDLAEMVRMCLGETRGEARRILTPRFEHARE